MKFKEFKEIIEEGSESHFKEAEKHEKMGDRTLALVYYTSSLVFKDVLTLIEELEEQSEEERPYLKEVPLDLSKIVIVLKDKS